MPELDDRQKDKVGMTAYYLGAARRELMDVREPMADRLAEELDLMAMRLDKLVTRGTVKTYEIELEITQRQQDDSLVKMRSKGAVIEMVGPIGAVSEALLNAEMQGNGGPARVHLYLNEV